MTKYKYWSVYEYSFDEHDDEHKRRIYTFNNENSANDLIEFILNHDFMQSNIGVEEHETSA